ncbi:hypothetical protein CBL_20602 [Carabus blaptoides fortunei]
MLDFKTILKDWQHFQRCKLQLKMANTFPCSFYGEGVTMSPARMSFITEPGEHRLEFRHASGMAVTILLTDLRGYNVDVTNITLILRPEIMLGSPILEFHSHAVKALFLEQLESFTRGIVGCIPTPPSSSSESD